ncbi:hypothetical protein TNCV_1991801 [Trichonephila clavipes]|nr:hypothetical protein TNCV_1991801 [Trichonephila clavipes]
MRCAMVLDVTELSVTVMRPICGSHVKWCPEVDTIDHFGPPCPPASNEVPKSEQSDSEISKRYSLQKSCSELDSLESESIYPAQAIWKKIKQDVRYASTQ